MTFFDKLAGTPDEDALESIARNLEAVLNAKQGYGAAITTFGYGGYDGFYGDKALVGALIAGMLDQVQRYEPRLAEPSVSLIGMDRALWVRFSLKARRDDQPCAFTVLFHSIFRNVRVLPA